jgi:hypothetical protein
MRRILNDTNGLTANSFLKETVIHDMFIWRKYIHNLPQYEGTNDGHELFFIRMNYSLVVER